MLFVEILSIGALLSSGSRRLCRLNDLAWERSAIGGVVSTVAALLELLRIGLDRLEVLVASIAFFWEGILLKFLL